MFYYNRRGFIKTSGSILGAAVLGELMFGCRQEKTPDSWHGLPARENTARMAVPQWGGFKYAMCNESMAGRGGSRTARTWAEQCQIVGNAGYRGIEIATFTFVKEDVQEITPAERKQMVSIMKNNGIECAGLHWLLAPPPKGLHFTTSDAVVRQKTIAYLDKLIDFCGDLGGPCMIFGSPKQRSTRGTSIEEAKKYFAEGLARVADHAQERRVKILVEPLGKSVTDVVNTLVEALELAGQVNHPAIQIMFDFNNTVDETEPFDVLLRKYYNHIHHVHVQEMGGKHLGTGTAVDDYVKAFQTLKDLRYDKWISLEVFDFSPGGKRIAEESMRILKQIEGKLV